MVLEIRSADTPARGIARQLRRLFAAGSSLLALSGCGVYLHDERLVAPATAATEKLTSAATLHPFDAQIANLSTFANDEDLVVARFWSAARDANLASVIASRAGSEREATRELTTKIEPRLQALLGSQPPDVRGKVGDLGRLIENRRVALAVADSSRRYYDENLRGKDEETDLGCKQLRLAMTLEQAEAKAEALFLIDDESNDSSPEYLAQRRQKRIAHITQSCWDAEAEQQRINDLLTTHVGTGAVAEAGRSFQSIADAAGSPDLSDHSQALKRAIKAAEEAAKNGAAADLEKFRKDVAQALAAASDATKLAGWQKINAAVEDLIRGQVCSARQGTLSDETVAAAKCDSVTAPSTAGRARAAWGLASAVAQLVEANAPQARSAQWLLAAKSIVAAEQADAKLQVERSARLATAERRRFESLLQEAALLQDALAGMEASGPRTCRGPALDCAIAAYSESWNNGRIPAEVLRYSPVQLEREYAVKRARAVAEKERALALAGTSALQSYAAAGIKPEAIAQALLDAGTIGLSLGD